MGGGRPYLFVTYAGTALLKCYTVVVFTASSQQYLRVGQLVENNALPVWLK